MKTPEGKGTISLSAIRKGDFLGTVDGLGRHQDLGYVVDVKQVSKKKCVIITEDFGVRKENILNVYRKPVKEIVREKSISILEGLLSWLKGLEI